MKKGGGKGRLRRCLSAPVRALSRACDSACHLYVRGMSGCARLVPLEAAAVGRGGGFGRGSAGGTMHLRVSSDRADDLVRAALKQRRVAAEPPAAGVVEVKKKGAGGGLQLGQEPAPAAVAARKKLGAGMGMGTISEDAPCEFAAAIGGLKSPTPRRRGAAVDGLAARPGGFGAIKVGSEAFAR